MAVYLKTACCALSLSALLGSYAHANPINGYPVSDEQLDTLVENPDSTRFTALQTAQYFDLNRFRSPDNYQHPPLQQAPLKRVNPRTGELTTTLTAGYLEYDFTSFKDNQAFTQRLRLRKYNQQPVGDTLVARPGDTLRIRLNNQLPPETNPPCSEDGECNHNRPHNFNTTNLHTHGLHVDPTGNSDNVFIKLQSGDSFDYEIKIPENHVAGTFWYHAHVHGGSSVQVGSGMSGALIIEGDYDRLPAMRDADDRIMMLQEIAFNDTGEIENNDTFAPLAWAEQAADRGWHISINGQVMPEVILQPGEVERWRFIHAGVRKNVKLALLDPCSGDRLPLVQVAADGIPSTTKRLSDDNSVLMAPGYRSDVMLKVRRRGTYYLVDEEVGPVVLGAQYCFLNPENQQFSLDGSAQNILARVVVRGARQYDRFPANAALAGLNRPRSIADSELSSIVEYLEFDIDISVDPWLGLINGKPYDPDQPRILKLNTAQTWKISSVFSHHPYHIHVNPFEVIFRNESGVIVDRIWKDTILVDELNDAQTNNIEIRSRYEDFTGAFVTHCHILDHEDHGMMEKVVIEP